MKCWSGNGVTDTIYSTIAAFVDRESECNDNPVLPSIHTLYLDALTQLLYPSAIFGGKRRANSELILTNRQINTLGKVLFGDIEDASFPSLNYNFLSDIVENIARFSDQNLLESFSFHYFNEIRQTFIRKKSVTRGSTLDTAEKLINSFVANEVCNSIVQVRKKQLRLSRTVFLTHLTYNSTSTSLTWVQIYKIIRHLLTSQSFANI